MKLLLPRLSFTAATHHHKSFFLRNRPNVIRAAGKFEPESNKVKSTTEPILVSERRKTLDYNALLLAHCRDGRVVEALNIFRCMTDTGLDPNLVSFNALIQGLCGKTMPKEAEEVLQEMKNRKGLVPDETTYTSLIHFFSSLPDKAYKFFTQMIDSGFSPSLATYNKLIRGYCLADRVEDALGILRGMPHRGLSPDVVTYNTLIKQICINQDPPDMEKALQLKAEMLHNGILPDAVTYSWLILPLVNKLEPRPLEAFDLFQEMLRGGLSPDECTYTSLMAACCLEGQFSKAFHLHYAMLHNGFLPGFVTSFSPSLVTYNAIIHGHCFLGRVDEALGILRGMPDMGLSPDNVSYSTVISGFCQIGEPRKAYELMVEMNEKQIKRGVDVPVYLSLMKGLSDEVTYTSLMYAYCAEGEVYKAIALSDEMKHFGSLQKDVRYIVLINGLDKKARTREAKEILLRMFCDLYMGLPTFTFDTLIENCSNNEFKSMLELAKDFWMRGLVNEAASALNSLLQWNHKPDGAVYNLLIVEHCRCGNVDKAYNMYTEMVHHGFASHMFSVLALINTLSYVRRYKEMSWVIENTLRSCNLNDSEIHKAFHEIYVRKGQFKGVLVDVLAEVAMDGLLLN